MEDTVIIGAGVAGMAAASALRAAGHSVTVLDKAERVGGRCATRRRTPEDPNSAWFDYGAQYFTARDARFRDVVDADLAAGRLTTWTPETCAARFDRTHGWQIEASPDSRERLIAPSGLGRWVRDRLDPSGARMHGASRVTSVMRDDDRWRIHLDTGRTLETATLVITLPAPQCATVLGASGADIAVLADADRALSACHSLVVEAPALPGCQAMFVKDGILSWLADNSHKAARDDEPRVWTLHAGPEYSDAHLEDDPDTVRARLIDAFAAVTGFDADRITTVRSHRWRYARPGPGAPDPGTLCHVEPDRGFALAGDWLAGGRVEGAWLSGHEAARRLMTG